MNWFYNLKIARKLILTFLVVVAFAVGVGIFALSELNNVNRAATDISSNWLPSIRTLSDIKLSLSRIRSAEFQHITASKPEQIQSIDADLLGLNAALIEQQKRYAIDISEPEEKALYPEIEKAIESLRKTEKLITTLSREGKKAEANDILRGEATPLYRSNMANIEKLVTVNNNGATASAKQTENIYHSARIWIMGALALCVLASMTLAMFVARTVSHPLNEAVRIASQVASGDLTADIRPHATDETGELMMSLKQMNDSLMKIVGEVRVGTDTIATASAEIAAGNLDLSSRTETQAGSLEETASAMEQLTSTVKQNADNARQANQLSDAASTVAIRAGDMVGQVVTTMEEINSSSKKIVDIISVIDGIAFQTNILALNAAVEAARAGEQGRGFAVVASEVRNLAQRSAAAAKEIKELIGDSVDKVDNGSKLVEQAGITMDEVVSSVKRVTDIMGEISAASQEQSTGIEEVNRAVTQMDEATQQNSALVEEAAAAAQSMQEQASHLLQAVSIFKLNNGNQTGASRTSAPQRSVNISPRPAKVAAHPAKTQIKHSANDPKMAKATADNEAWEQF
ncbi:methyl-accepting chemotaxis protein [Herbaspirillum sp. RTI4]|uniref:methyl-accepting chemotaxis protein n=1 Tax=Herbaspirillum sp. RTI4 TaxID=3048640 RepID=UPI002AB4922D|nr:methyl-accepting chemotaxis protein [Herbaspirillum sp. RTI4]MDY7578222.1 methyl-accepting chemotaxis protein [Herbaspirillum sp. RTI4]MEA9981560.1 methyl-accepting chemotaxis protein [Herbaspirillum sp. RTI4]